MSDQPRLPFQVAFLTGQSRPSGVALSPVQANFLAALPAPSASRMPINFPYRTRTADQPFAPTPLLVASVRNVRQYLSSRRPWFAERHRAAVEAFVARADHTLLLAGSCGLELFNNLALSANALRRVTIFAYGPVARRQPDCPRLLVQGRRDWLSRRYFRTVDVQVNTGHMDYLTDPVVLALAATAVCHLAAR